MLPGIIPVIGGSQNILSTTFKEYPVGLAPSGWTARWTTAGWTPVIQSSSGSISGQALRITKTIANRGIFTWDRVPPLADFEILARGRAIQAPGVPDTVTRIAGRASGAVGTENAYSSINFYHTSAGTKWRQQSTKYVAGTASIANGPVDGGSPNFVSTVPTVWVYNRLRVVGTTVSYKSWQSGNAEPGSWGGTFTDTSLSGGGWVGIVSSEASPDQEYDFFSVALRGLTVPVPV